MGTMEDFTTAMPAARGNLSVAAATARSSASTTSTRTTAARDRSLIMAGPHGPSSAPAPAGQTGLARKPGQDTAEKKTANAPSTPRTESAANFVVMREAMRNSRIEIPNNN